MNKQERLKAQARLIEARDGCNWVIKNQSYGGLTSDLPYSKDDITQLKEAKGHIGYIHDKLQDPYPPPEPPPPSIIKTKYPLFEHNYLLGYVPWDFHALNLPFHANFGAQDWEEGAALMAKNRVNGTRFFLATGEKAGDLRNYHIPFLRTDGKFDLTEFGENDMKEIEWRLEKFWERGITTMICLATGIKGQRFKHTVWHKSNNINGTTDNHRNFMDHLGTTRTYMKVIRNLWARWKHKPVIFEFINEPKAFGYKKQYSWYRKMMTYCLTLGIPRRQFAFEKFNSGLIEDLLKKYNCWMFCHAMNSLEHMKRIHRGEMQGYYFNPYEYVASNSDGAGEFPGTGLVGKGWGKSLRKPAPKDMQNGLKLDYRKNGAGWFIGSAGAYFANVEGDKPNFEHWRHAAVDGLNKRECKFQGVDWKLFSYRKCLKRKPLGELKAIRKASKILG